MDKKILITIFSLIFFIPIAKGNMIYTPTSQITCVNDKCATTLYSGVMFSDSKGTLTANTKSLKNCEFNNSFNIQYIENDDNYNIEVLDYNSTWIKFNVNLKGFTIFPNTQSISILNYAIDEKSQTTILKNSKTEQRTFYLFNQKDTIEYSLKDGYYLGSMIKFGENSTIITLNETNSGNVGDTEVRESAGTTNYGIEIISYVRTDPADNRRTYILWNLSAIPSGATINNANMSIFSTNGPDATRTYQAYNTTNNWQETTLTWDNQPSLGTLQDTFAISTDDNVWLYSNITNAVAYQLSQTNKNVSIVIKDETEGSSRQTSNVRTKEYTTDTTKRPQLVITYTIVTDSCSYTSGNWLINCADNCQITTNTNMAGNSIIFYGTGSAYLNANIVNISQKTFSPNCPVIIGNGKVFG